MTPEAPLPPFSIRAATLQDCDSVLRLWKAPDVAESVTDDVAALTRLLQARSDGLLVAEAEEQIVGSVIATSDHWRGFIYRLVVDPRWRRSGMGGALIREATARLCRDGVRRVIAFVIKENDVATSFWDAQSSRGWRRDDQLTRYVLDVARQPS